MPRLRFSWMLPILMLFGCSSVRLPKLNIRLTAPPDFVLSCAARGAISAGWTVVEREPALVVETQQRGHSLTASIVHSDSTLAVRHLRSERLEYDTDGHGVEWIHHAGATWLVGLTDAIQKACTEARPEFVLVRRSVRPLSGRFGDAPSVVPSSRYQELRTRARRVVAVAPGCANTSSAGDTRQRQTAISAGELASGEMLGTDCGVEMAGVERALADKFTVLSWRTFAGHANPVDLGRAQGVDLIFQINSLELAGGRDVTEFTNEWFWSNSKGEAVSPISETSAAPLTPDDIRGLNALVDEEASPRMPSVIRTDVSVIDVASGETAWLYRRVQQVGGPSASQHLLLYRGDPPPGSRGMAVGARRWQKTSAEPVRTIPAASPSSGLSRGGIVHRGGTFDLARDAIIESGVRQAVECFRDERCD